MQIKISVTGMIMLQLPLYFLFQNDTPFSKG